MKKLVMFLVLLSLLLTSCGVKPEDVDAKITGLRGEMVTADGTLSQQISDLSAKVTLQEGLLKTKDGEVAGLNSQIKELHDKIVALESLDGVGIGNRYMINYQKGLEYTVALKLQVPTDTLEGFVPVASLVMNPDSVDFPAPATDLTPYRDFVDVSGTWGGPIAGYNDGENFSCDSPNGWCSDDIQAFNWRVNIGFEVCHPAVGCIKDPDGGAAMILFDNYHDSDEVWGPRNQSAIYIDNGFIGYGPFWDHSGKTYDVIKGEAAIVNHYLYQLGIKHTDNHLEGQCGSSGLCETVTYVVIHRVADRSDLGIGFSHYELVGWGQWVRP